MEKPDFSVVTGQEKHLRSAELKNAWMTTARYGNTERKRVKNEKEGVVGPLNALFNMAGAQLRDYFLRLFPFPEPIVIGNKGRTTIRGYDGGSMYGSVPVAHGPDLPELDFADMIRSHLREYCRKAFIHNVPIGDARSYVSFLIRQLIPFVEYVYTSGQSGRRGFKRARNKKAKKRQQGPDADQILRALVQEIEALYGKRTGRAVAPTSRIPEPNPEACRQFFVDQIHKLQHSSQDLADIEQEYRQDWITLLDRLLEGKKPKLRDKDAERLRREVIRKARWAGIRWHSLLANGLPQPFTLRSVILDGDRLADSGEELLIAAEVPLETPMGKGRADLIVFKRRIIQNPRHPGKLTIWQPIAVFDIKTRTAFHWEVRTKRPRGQRRADGTEKKREKMVPKLETRMRGLTDMEWEEAITEVPTKTDVQQLGAYSAGIANEYRKATGDQESVDILRGIVLVDTQQDARIAQSQLLLLVRHICRDSIRQNQTRLARRMSIRSKNPAAKRVAILLCGCEKTKLMAIGTTGVPVKRRVSFNPFVWSTSKDRRHILYLSVRSASRSGPTAAWTAEYWHALQFLYDLKQSEDKSKVVWLDLAGNFHFKPLAETRLRIKSQQKHIRTFFNSIEIKDMSSSIYDYLFKGGEIPDIDSLTSPESEKPSDMIVVVTGWGELENETPQRLKAALLELERVFVGELNALGCTTVWFVRPKPSNLSSAIYQRRGVVPFWEDSPHRYHVTDLVWNLPVRPSIHGRTTPLLDNVRVIIRHSKTDIEWNLIEVPPLQDWSSRFWSKREKAKATRRRKRTGRGRRPLLACDVISSPQRAAFRAELIRDSLDLIPWLRALYPSLFEKEAEMKPDSDSLLEITPLPEKAAQHSGIMSRMSYRARVNAGTHGKGFVTSSEIMPTQKITHPRQYREDRLEREIVAQTHRPPNEGVLVLGNPNEKRAQRVEIRRLRQTIRFLSAHKRSGHKGVDNKEEEHLLSDLQEIVSKQTDAISLDMLNEVAHCLKTDSLSVSLWNTLEWTRESRLTSGLRGEVKQTLDILMETRPHLALFHGNYLFLLLTAIRTRFPSLSQEHLRHLWEVLKPWQLMQLGTTPDQTRMTQARSVKFDVRAIWANLSKRAEFLAKVPRESCTNVVFGQILYHSDDDDNQYSWVAIEDSYDKRNMLNGLWIGRGPLELRNTIRWSTTQHDLIAKGASICVNSNESYSLAVSSFAGAEYLWAYDAGKWQLLGRMTLIRRKRGAITAIRGLGIHAVSPDNTPEEPKGLTIQPSLRTRVKKELRSISKMLSKVDSIECKLSTDSGKYVVNLYDKSGGDEPCDQRSIFRTSDLLELLRRPMVDGVSLQSSKKSREYYMWNPYKDIDYGELQLLRPYVERRTPFINVRLPLPLTAKELTSREVEYETMIIRHDESLCPIAQGIAEMHGVCWRVEFPVDLDDSLLLELSQGALADNEVVGLMSGGVFLETARYEFDVEASPDPETRDGVVFRESGPISRKLSLKRARPGAYLEMREEKLTCSVCRDGTGVKLTALSDQTGDEVCSWLAVTLEPGVDVQDGLDFMEKNIQEIVQNYFDDEEEPCDRIHGYDELLARSREILRDIYITLLETEVEGEDTEEEVLEAILEFRREEAVEEFSSIEVAEALYELAALRLKRKSLRESLDNIEECIEIYQEFISRWKVESYKKALSGARRLRRRILRAM